MEMGTWLRALTIVVCEKSKFLGHVNCKALAKKERMKKPRVADTILVFSAGQ